MRWAAYSLQLATAKIHMCVVALTASIAACNIKLVDDLSAVRHECDTEQIAGRSGPTAKSILGTVCTM